MPTSTHRKITTALLAAALCSAPAQPALANLERAPLAAPAWPERCGPSPLTQTDETRPPPVVAYARRPGSGPNPPAPPPPPASSAEQSIVVTGARVAGPGPTFIPAVRPAIDPGRERYEGENVAPALWAHEEPVSTFSVDVDTAAYANVRRFLSDGNLPPQAAVRTEELINYFRYDYPEPADDEAPFSVTTDMAVTPWNEDTRLLRIGLRGYDLPRAERPAANLVFLLDVSGSMHSRDKLPLVQTAMHMLAGELGDEDRVSIVVYAGAAGVVLEPTNDECDIRRAIESLRAGGSTAGGAGIRLAYDVARGSFIEGGVNRVILCTDGDFNVGVSDHDALVELIEKERRSGVTLTTLGFGTGNLNDAMMEQIADHGNGNYAYIDSAMEARKVLSEEMASTLFTIAHDVKIQVEFNPAKVSQYRLIGYENRALREEDFDNDAVDAGEIGAGHQVTALYEIVPAGASGWMQGRRYSAPANTANGQSADEVAFVQLRYKLPGRDSSILLQQPVSASLMDRAGTARGDMAFASAVAAYGQILRGDTLLNGFGFDDTVELAGRQDGYWREEFVQLAQLADALDGRR
ncbi:vWA domain-containing protein [Alteraurantiacibacter aquimixticola]|uniref:VWA domain-containing protein n=1 Tax=Alteraurantiacibacter aquimixticola TaxID=2489173 RepID=A0A4T3F2S5_9SPHN|nr:VWA domain-containing protein [Alteraurantiacibacter aquimixticola]TIX50615.1 VWA domain-containing protein [Alteraurantiacibacter aquimixticola]